MAEVMGLQDKDYMRDEPDDEAAGDYEPDLKRRRREAFEANYGSATAKRSARLRGIAIRLILLMILIVVVAVIPSR